MRAHALTAALALLALARVAHAEDPPPPKPALSTPKPTPGPKVDPPPNLATPASGTREPAPAPAPPVRKPEGEPVATPAPEPAPRPRVAVVRPALVPPLPQKYKYEKEHPKKAIPTFRLGAGYDWHSYYGVPFRGFDVNADVGVEYAWAGAYIGLGGSFDSTSATLSSRKLRMETGFEVILGRVRLGLELNTSYLNVDRGTRPHDNFEVLTSGLVGQATVDLLRFQPRGAIYVQAKLGGDIFPGGDGEGAGWGSTFSVGYRY